MQKRYLYSCVWTNGISAVETRTYLANRASKLLDFDRDVTEFGRNTERLRCRCKGKTYQLTPELFLVYGGERMLLHCASMDNLHADAFTQLRESYPIKLWTEKLSLSLSRARTST